MVVIELNKISKWLQGDQHCPLMDDIVPTLSNFFWHCSTLNMLFDIYHLVTSGSGFHFLSLPSLSLINPLASSLFPEDFYIQFM